MDMRQVLLSAINERALMGYAFGRKSLSKKVIKVFEENGVDIDDVIREVEENEDDHLDI